MSVERSSVHHGIAGSAMPASVSAAAVSKADDMPDEDLIRAEQSTAWKWITHPPTRCPNGHSRGGNINGPTPQRRCTEDLMSNPSFILTDVPHTIMERVRAKVLSVNSSIEWQNSQWSLESWTWDRGDLQINYSNLAIQSSVPGVFPLNESSRSVPVL